MDATRASLTCPRCGATTNPDARFCERCGAAVTAAVSGTCSAG